MAEDPSLRAKGLTLKAIDDAMCGLDCGQYLRDARARLQQHEWEVWVSDHLPFDLELAEVYINLYEKSFRREELSPVDEHIFEGFRD